MRTLLLIGGSGFFGKSFLDAHKRGGLRLFDIQRIKVIARHASELKSTHPHLLDHSIDLIDADISTLNSLPEADVVIHAAASTDIRNYINQPLSERQNIQAGTYNYCDLALKFHKSSKIVYCSSGAIYGQQPQNVQCVPEAFDPGPVEEMIVSKRDYAVAKRDAEQAIVHMGHNGCETAIARCFAFVGGYLPLDQHFAIGNFIRDGLAGGPILVRATHRVVRSYMYADDLVRWLMTIAESATQDTPTFNVGSDEALTMGEVAAAVAKHFDVEAIVPDLISDKVDNYVPSIGKARQQLGLGLQFNLAQAIAESEKTIRSLGSPRPQ